MFKNATGVACPSCGSTRALMSIAKGDFTQALMTDPIGYIGLAVMLIVPVLLIVGTLRKKNLVSDFFSKTEKPDTPAAMGHSIGCAAGSELGVEHL